VTPLGGIGDHLLAVNADVPLAPVGHRVPLRGGGLLDQRERGDLVRGSFPAAVDAPVGVLVIGISLVLKIHHYAGTVQTSQNGLFLLLVMFQTVTELYTLPLRISTRYFRRYTVRAIVAFYFIVEGPERHSAPDQCVFKGLFNQVVVY
jgi:hypothetical protein